MVTTSGGKDSSVCVDLAIKAGINFEVIHNHTTADAPETNAFVAEHHRHHKPVVGHKFSIGCTDGEKIVGVAIVGRPISRYLDDGWTLEVNRCCTDGTRNACSILYAAAWRAARAMGYHKLITYILDTEPGTSLKAAGWKCIGKAGGLRWTGKRRPEIDLCPAQMKIKWEVSTECES